MEIASFDREIELQKLGYDQVFGIDEAGRGPLAGPVVAAACVLKSLPDNMEEDPLWDFVRDSKTISEKKRDAVYAFVREKYFVGVGVVEALRIDEINILQATFESMRQAVGELESQQQKIFNRQNVIALVDGNALIPSFDKEQKTVTRGDSKVKCIAAASIIAKVTRDRLMLMYGKDYPQYGFEKHKGYGTKLHMEMLVKYGASPIHRKSFGPVRKVS